MRPNRKLGNELRLDRPWSIRNHVLVLAVRVPFRNIGEFDDEQVYVSSASAQVHVSVNAWNCAWLTSPLVSRKRNVVIGVRIKRWIETNKIDTGIREPFCVPQPSEVVAEVKAVHVVTFIARSTIMPLALVAS